jgi:hypothetical protein
MRAGQQGEPVAPVGAGAPLPAFHDDLYWTGSFVQSGIYYVLVESSGRGLSNYMLTIQGSNVSFPLLSFTRPQPPIANQVATCSNTDANLPPAPTLSPASVPPVEPPLSSPEAPLPAIGRVTTISSHERHWYAFRDEGDDAAIAMRATATPPACIDFALWTPEQLELWRQNIEFQPVGQGTVNQQFGGDLFWTGSFVKSGNYYVVVTPNPAQQGDCTYQLRITGEDVSLILPPRN